MYQTINFTVDENGTFHYASDMSNVRVVEYSDGYVIVDSSNNVGTPIGNLDVALTKAKFDVAVRDDDLEQAKHYLFKHVELIRKVRQREGTDLTDGTFVATDDDTAKEISNALLTIDAGISETVLVKYDTAVWAELDATSVVTYFNAIHDWRNVSCLGAEKDLQDHINTLTDEEILTPNLFYEVQGRYTNILEGRGPLEDPEPEEPLEETETV